MKKKLAIIGKGTAGVFALSHYLRFTDVDIDFYWDPKISAQSVGEGSTLHFPRALYHNMAFSYGDLQEIDGTFKYGIKKTGWGKGNDFIHEFVPPNVSYHFNAVKFQNFVFDKLKDKINVIEKNVLAVDVDADFVMDCSGKPDSYDGYNMTDTIPVNSVYVTQCYWDYPRFQYTLTIARPYGWVFGIPLNNRCSIGYMYNKDINTLEEVQEDVKQVFKDYNLTPSQDTNSFSFNNYYRKQNFTNKVAYNGNASFFLEPLEATSISVMDLINRISWEVWFNGMSVEAGNALYNKKLLEIENVIMLHYCAGSIFDTEFWKFAKIRGEKNMKDGLKNPDFADMIKESKKSFKDWKTTDYEYGLWPVSSFRQNLESLDLYNKLK